MAIDVTSEEILAFSKAARTPPLHVHVSCLHRWRHGVRGVKLETCLIGGRRYTSRQAIERFIAATTATADHQPAPARTPRRRERDIAAAEREIGKCP